MYTIYKRKAPATPLEETSWGKFDLNVAEKPAKDLTEEDMITIAKGDKNHTPTKVRKGEGYSWLQYCQKPVDIKVVGVFDTVGALGWPENIFIDVSKWNKPYGFYNTDIHPSKSQGRMRSSHESRKLTATDLRYPKRISSASAR